MGFDIREDAHEAFPRLTLLLLDRILFRGMVLVETRDLFADEACDKDHTPRNGTAAPRISSRAFFKPNVQLSQK